MKQSLTIFLVLGIVKAFCQSLIITELNADTFLIRNDTLISIVREIETTNEPCELKAYIYQLRYTYEGFNKREVKGIYFFNKDTVKQIINLEPEPDYDFGYDFKTLESFPNNQDDINEIINLKKLKGFYIQGIELNDEVAYRKDHVTLIIFYDKEKPTFGYVKFGPFNAFLNGMHFNLEQQETLKNFIDSYF